MIFTILISLFWGVFLTLFVLTPLLGVSKRILILDKTKNNNKKELLIQSKNELLKKIAFGQCQNSNFNSLSNEEAMEKLLDISEKLESGKISLQFIVIVLTLICCLFSYPKIFSQEVSPGVVIPPAVILEETGYWLPAVNQFILMPDQGQLRIYYVGMFNNQFHAKRTKILLPFPKNSEGIIINGSSSSVLESDKNKNVILNTPLQPKTNQIQAEFILKAETGVAQWKKNSLSTLPGVSIFIMPEYSGILRNMISKIIKNINLWPARFQDFPQDFKMNLSTNILSQDSKTDSGQLSRQFVRVGGTFANYPEFRVIGLVPSRLFLILLISFFACFFAAAFFIFIFKLKS